MTSRDQAGFTLVEIILFFALSSAFIVIAFIGIQGRNANAQFTDSMRSLQSFITSEQNKIQNGVNSASAAPSDCDGTTPGSSNDCILMGRIITFGIDSADMTKVGVSVMYGQKLSTQYFEDYDLSSDIAQIDASSPKTDTTSQSYSISWDTKFIPDKSKNGGASSVEVDKFGWLRSPTSNNLVPIVVNSSYDLNSSGADIYKKSSDASELMDEIDARFCFQGVNNRVASINFDKNGVVTLVFDDEACL